jgi:predicted nucleic acid-binding protein
VIWTPCGVTENVLIDTSVWVDFFADRQLPHVAQAKQAIIGGYALIGDLVLVEVLQGFKHDRQVHSVLNAFKNLGVETLCSPELAPKAALTYRTLRQKGITVRGTIDVIIATWCIENRVALLHNDRDFLPLQRELGLIAFGDIPLS